MNLIFQSQVFSNLEDLGQELQKGGQTSRLSPGKCQQGREGAGTERHMVEKPLRLTATSSLSAMSYSII